MRWCTALAVSAFTWQVGVWIRSISAVLTSETSRRADTGEGIAFEVGIQFCAYHRSREPPRFCSSTRSLFSARVGTPAARRSSESGSPPDRASFRLARSVRGPRRARRVRPRRRTGSSGAARHRAEGQRHEEHNGNDDDKDTKSTRNAMNNTKTTERRVRRETREYEVQVEITSKSGVESARGDAADEVLNKMPIGWRPAGGTAAGDRHRCCRDARERRAPGIHRWRPARPRASTGTAATPQREHPQARGHTTRQSLDSGESESGTHWIGVAPSRPVDAERGGTCRRQQSYWRRCERRYSRG